MSSEADRAHPLLARTDVTRTNSSSGDFEMVLDTCEAGCGEMISTMQRKDWPRYRLRLCCNCTAMKWARITGRGRRTWH